MAIEVKIPAVGESISSGVVSVWHKKSGDFVNAGDALFTLETDKVSTEIVAEKAGILETSVPEGREVKIGEVVATIDDSKSAPKEKSKEPSPQSSPSGRGGKAGQEQAKLAAPLSPSVRRIVEEEQVDPSKVPGSGKDGRLTKGDVLQAAQGRGATEKAASVPETAVEAPQDRQPTDGRVVRRKMSPLRRKIATQLVMAQHNAAILTTFNECDMSGVQKFRADSQEAFSKKHGVK